MLMTDIPQRGNTQENPKEKRLEGLLLLDLVQEQRRWGHSLLIQGAEHQVSV